MSRGQQLMSIIYKLYLLYEYKWHNIGATSVKESIQNYVCHKLDERVFSNPYKGLYNHSIFTVNVN